MFIKTERIIPFLLSSFSLIESYLLFFCQTVTFVEVKGRWSKKCKNFLVGSTVAQHSPDFSNKVWTINTGCGASLSRLVCSIKVYNHQMNLETSAPTECLVHVSRPPPCLTRQHRRTHKHSTDDHKEQIQAGSFPPPCDLDMHAHCCS